MDSGKPRVLLVEDEILIALDTTRLLEELGYSVVGPASSHAEALRLIEAEEIDAAIIDVRLRGGEVSTAAIERLLARGVPVVVATAYGDGALGSAFANLTIVRKPYAADELQSAIRAAFETRGGKVSDLP